jgi:hypothetical protein
LSSHGLPYLPLFSSFITQSLILSVTLFVSANIFVVVHSQEVPMPHGAIQHHHTVSRAVNVRRNLVGAGRPHYLADRPDNLVRRPPISPIFPLLFGTTLFLPLYHSISEDFLTWCLKAHQVRYKYLLPTFNFVE